ncbi:sensor histidine kinase [candidate division KSB1 bacterium]|nr:MAG: sensor histidine kinase [candidate division KSB1 bacterium]
MNGEREFLSSAFNAADAEGALIAALDSQSGMLDLLNKLPVMSRVVAADGRVLWQSRSLETLLQPRSERGCCESLGLRHSDAECPSVQAIRTGRRQKRQRWLGRYYVSMENFPLAGLFGEDVVSMEVFHDVTTEKKLEAALARQQSLLETINRAMIKINHNLESAQRELEEKNWSLEQANRQLRSLDQMKDEFISIVSHELKAPLTSIKGSVELIRTCEHDKLSTTGHDLLSVCQRNINRLHRLVQDLLDIARIESGRLSLEFSTFNASDVVEECLQSERALADKKEVFLENAIPENLEITADRERFIQVIVNLVNNAVKFTDHGAVTVEAFGEPGSVTVHVRDTGIGIGAEEQTRIFDKFAQVGCDLNRNSGGTGLGLSIVRGIIREHGGEIHVASEPGHGSCFTLTLPQPPGRLRDGEAGPLD